MVWAIDSIKHVVCGVLIGALLASGGCSRRVYFLREEDVGRYEKTATGIAWPDVHEPASPAVTDTLPPRTLTQPHTPHGIREMTLEACLRIALANNQVIRDLGGRVLQSPDGTPTVYDPAIRASDPRSSVEAALSEFDANFASSITWTRTDRPVNNAVSVGNLQPTLDAFIFEEDSANFLAELNKTTPSGTRLAVRNRIDYRLNNAGSNRFPSAYDTNVEFEFRQPLLQGAGVEFNRIAGPSRAPGFYFPNGVLLARINEDIAIAEFERAVRDLVSQVEDTYWSLYFAYRELGAQIQARDAALKTWQSTYARWKEGAQRGGLAEVSQALVRYETLQEAVAATKGGSTSFVTDTSARGGLYGIESNLRQLLGLPVNDGYLIRPADEPITAPFTPDWHVAMSEALTQRLELRQQKWRIKRRDLELTATREFLKPQLDFTALYRINGFGDRLTAADSNNARFQNAFETLTGGNFTDWQLGLQFSVPIGLRQAMTAVYWAEHQLARERMLLKAQEEKVSHDLGGAFRAIDTAYSRMEINFNRFKAAQDFLRSTEVLYTEGVAPLDQLLDAQRDLALAESAYYRSAVEYTLALKQLEFEKGTLLAYNNIHLTEGSWPARAYEDSFDRSRERYHARPVDIGKTEPAPFVELRDADAVSTVGSAADNLFDESTEAPGPALFPAEGPADEAPALPETIESEQPGTPPEIFEPPSPADAAEALPRVTFDAPHVGTTDGAAHDAGWTARPTPR